MAIRGSGALAGGVWETVVLVGSGRPLGDRRIARVRGAFDVVVLAAFFRATGSAVPPLGSLVLGYTIGQLGGLIPAPGGIGPTGIGLVGALVLYGASIGPVTAAVLVYRTVQLGLPAVLGAPAFVLLHRDVRRRAGRSTAICEPLAERPAATADV